MMPTLKERIENHIVIILIGAIIAGFASGYSAYNKMAEMSGSKVITESDLKALQGKLNAAEDEKEKLAAIITNAKSLWNNLVPLRIKVINQVSVTSGATGTVSVNCPDSWKVISGDIGPTPTYYPFDVRETKMTDSGKGWKITAWNKAGDQRGPQLLTVEAVCERPNYL